MDEFGLISRYFHWSLNHRSVALGVGDDCALLTLSPGHQLAMSMDTLVAGTHFFPNMEAQHIATRAFGTCLSDLAAMGARPVCFTLGLTLPDVNTEWLQAFSAALRACAEAYQCPLVGGDTTQGPLAITLQVHGEVPCNKALVRSGAKVNDRVYVTGPLGDGAAALALLQRESNEQAISVEHQRYLKQRFYAPEPQIQAGLTLRDLATSAIDISDGLLADLQHIARASHVDICVELGDLPLSAACRSLSEDNAVDWALSGGDDYQLAFTLPPEYQSNIAQQLNCTAIGWVRSVQAQPSVFCYRQGEICHRSSCNLGYLHFK